MKFHLFVYLFSCLSYSISLYGQEQYIQLSGHVKDSNTDKAISYANIQLKKGNIATSANASGDFLFKVPSKLLPDSLLISCIGFEPFVMPVPRKNQIDMVFPLQKAVISLNEVTVTTRSGLGILKEAIARIPQNYDTTNIRLTGFYREDIRLKNDTINFNESVLDIYKTFNTTKVNQDQIRLLKGRKLAVDLKDDPRFYSWIKNITNTAYSSLMEDIQKHTSVPVSFMNEKNFDYYRFDYNATIQEGGKKLMVIAFEPKKPSKRTLLYGKLYIEGGSFAIVKCEWSLTPEGVKYVNRHGRGGVGYTIMSKILGASIDFTGIKTVITYKKQANKWYLASINRHWNADVNSRKRQMKAVPWIGDFTLLITAINESHAKPFTQEVINKTASVNSQISQVYDTAFWENYNFLLPEVPDSLSDKAYPSPSIEDSTEQAQPTVHISNRGNGFTRADTLRGMLTPLRTCYDVKFYHLDVDVDLQKHYIKGNNKIRFSVVPPFSKMQIDLYASMKINRILFHNQPLHYTRTYNAVFVDLPAVQQTGSEQELVIEHHSSPVL